MNWLTNKFELAKVKLRGVKRFFGVMLILIGLSLFLFSSYLSIFDNTAGGILSDDLSRLMTSFGAIAGLILIVLRPIWLMVMDDGHLTNIVVTHGEDMRQMAKYMKSADKVVIYSGDFSYIYDHEPLAIVMRDLAARDELYLLSYKAKDLVLASSNSKRGDRDCLITALIDKGKIWFELPGKPKFSLVYRRGEEVLLYRHRSEGTEFVTIFKATKEMPKELIRILNMLVDGIIKQAPRS